MKLMFASDIHGSLHGAEKMGDAYENERADKLVLLGDLLYHGPRNPLPKKYDPQAVAALLNSMKQELLCVRGNCDCEVDQMLLEVPILSDYALLYADGLTIFATHGHIYNETALPPLCAGNILIHGHTHIPGAMRYKGLYCFNPGSVSLPKQDFKRSYMVYENGVFTVKDFKGNLITSLTVG